MLYHKIKSDGSEVILPLTRKECQSIIRRKWTKSDIKRLKRYSKNLHLKKTRGSAINYITDKYGEVLISRTDIKLKQYLKRVKLPFLLDFFRWVLIDWYRGKKERLFGIYMFCGLFGEGKTLSMVNHAEKIRERMPDVKIYSNFGYKNENGKIEKWQDLLTLPHRSIAMIDEIQTTFSSNDWKDFPKDLLTNITQCRKRELQLVCTAQIYRRVAVQIRELLQYVVQCENIGKLDRMFKNTYYLSEDYEQRLNSIPSGKHEKIQPSMLRFFVASDEHYDLYNTLTYVESLMKKEDNDKKLVQRKIIKQLEKEEILSANAI